LDRFKTLWAWSAGTAEATGCRVGGCDRRGGRSAPRPSRRSGHASPRRARQAVPCRTFTACAGTAPHAVRLRRAVPPMRPGEIPLPVDLPTGL